MTMGLISSWFLNYIKFPQAHIGRSAAWAIDQQLKSKYNISYEPSPRGKDFNEYLMYMKR